MKLIDLHTHTTFSDGTFSPEELMKYAKDKNLYAVAVTDHDTVRGLSLSAKWADHYDIEFIPGVEIEALYNEREIHILGLFIDHTNEELLALLKNLREMRNARDTRILEVFNADGICAKLEDIQAFAKEGIISRPHFARYLVENGYYESISDAMRNYLGRGKKAYVARPLPKPNEVFEIVKKYHFTQFDIIDAMFRSMAKVHGNMKGKHQTLTWSFIGTINSYISLFFSGVSRQELNEKSAGVLVHQFMHGIYA
jgi:predicted metal-dependent phosphoesterase TrpH